MPSLPAASWPQANGLALPGSDLDIVVLRAGGPELLTPGAGYGRRDRTALRALLEDLLGALGALGTTGGTAQVIDAKVPIIKCRLVVPGGETIHPRNAHGSRPGALGGWTARSGCRRGAAGKGQCSASSLESGRAVALLRKPCICAPSHIPQTLCRTKPQTSNLNPGP